ncbi:MAG: PAS domain S-box protein [Nitrospirae bacterium]|nr:PAS domain S-box protein [Nitrospirota bacterium]
MNRRNLLSLLTFMSLLLTAMSVFGISGMKSTKDSLETVYYDRVVPLKDIKIISDMYAVNIVDTTHKVRNGSLTWADGREKVDNAVRSIRERWKSYNETILDSEEKKLISEIEPLLLRANTSVEKLGDILRREDRNAIIEYSIKELSPSIDPVTNKLNELEHLQLKIASKEHSKASRIYKTSRNLVFGGLVIGLVLAIWGTIKIVSSITKPLQFIIDENILNGFAYCRMIFDNDNKPLDYIYLDINKSFEKITGLKKEDVLNKPVTTLIPGIRDDYPELFDIYGRVALTGIGETFEINIRQLQVWFYINVYSPEKGYFIAIFEDITKRKKLESELIENEKRFRSAFEFSTIGVAITSPEKGWIEVNDEICKIMGYSRQELAQMTWTEMTHPDDLEADVRQFNQVINGEMDGYSLEKRFIRKDGSVMYTTLWVNCKRSDNSKVDYFIALLQDITQRKDMEDEIKVERDKLMSIVETIDAGIYIVNKTHDIEYINPIIEREFGTTKGRKCFEYFHNRTESCPWCKNKDVFSGKSVYWEWYSFKNKRTYKLFDTPIRNKDDSISKFEIFYDITEQKDIQNTLNRELQFKSAFAEVSEALLSHSSDIIDIARIVHSQTTKLTGSLHGYVGEIDIATNELVCHTFSDMIRDEQCRVDPSSKRVIFPKGPDGYNALWGYNLNTKEAFYTNSPAEHPSYKGCTPEGHIPIERFLAVPAIIGDVLIGQIALANADRDYTDEDLNTIKRLADIYAIAVDRKRMELEIKVERDKLISLMEKMEDGVYIVNKHYNIEYINQMIQKDLGQINNRKCFEYIYDRKEVCTWCKLKDVLSGKTIHWEWHYDKNNNTYHRYDTPIKNKDGSISKVAIFHDITELKHIQNMLQRELQFRSALAEVSEVFLSTDKDIIDIAEIVYRQALMLTGSKYGFVLEIDRYTHDAVILKVSEITEGGQCTVDPKSRRLSFPKGPDGYNALWGHVLNTRQGFYTNSPAEHPSYKGCIPEGHIPIERFLAVPAVIGDVLIGQIAIANAERDYTEDDLNIIQRLASIYAMAVDRKRAEADILEFNRNLEQKVVDETKRRSEQEQLLIQQSKMAAMGEMISSIAHQWKQPLNVISLIVQDLADAYSFGELDKEYMNKSEQKIMQQIQFMAKTIDDFRDFLRPSKEKSMFDLKKAIEDIINMFSPLFKKNGIALNLLPTEEVNLTVLGYPNEFKQVVLNLINNSRDAIISRREKGLSENRAEDRIDINLLKTDGKLAVSIGDTGGGIPKDIIDKIFDPYFTTKTSDKGTGIGLYMSKTIIENNMGWRLTVSNTNGGAEFRIEI